MAEKNEESIDALRDELNTLRNQMETLVKSLGEKGEEASSDMVAKLEKELEHYRKLAADKMHKAYEAGSAGIERWASRCAVIPWQACLPPLARAA